MLVPLNSLGGASHSLTARHSRTGRYDPNGETFVGFSCKDHGADAQEDYTPTLRAMGHSRSHANAGGQLAVAHTLKGGGFDASEDGTGRGTPLVPTVYSIMPQNSGKDYKARPVDVAQPVMAGGPVGGNQGGDFVMQPLAFDTTQITSKANRCQPEAGGPCHPLPAHGHAPALAFHARQDPDSGEVTHPLDTDGFSIGIQQACAVRRLTPRECERLMGYEDDFTLITYRGKPAADGPRYRALGNSMCVNVMAWIGQRIALFETIAARAEGLNPAATTTEVSRP